MPEPPAIPSSWLKEEVYCASLSIEHISKHCSHCFSTLTNLRRCATCKVSHYCRPECQKSDWGVHSAECAAFARTESVCDDGMRLVMRMSKLYAKTIRRSSEEDMKACTYDEQKRYPIRGILALDDHFEQQKDKADQWIVEYQKFFGSLPVSVDVTKRLFAMANINSFGVTNEHGRVIGVAMCLGLSALNHSCKPTARIAFRGRTALIVPCDPAHITSSSNTCHSYIDNLLIRSERKRLLKIEYRAPDIGYDNCPISGGLLVEEEMSLVSLEDGSGHSGPAAQPMWIHTCDEVEFEIGRIRSRMEELNIAQRNHLSRSNFGDEAVEIEEEKKIEGLTEQITSMIAHSQRLIGDARRSDSQSEVRLRDNAVAALLQSLGQITADFKSRQATYLSNIKRRAQNVDAFLLPGLDDQSVVPQFEGESGVEYSMEQIQQIFLNENMVREREKEVLAVNSSILELNALFKDISSMIVDQGSVLDRIDYNIEQTSMRVGRAVDSVFKAERYQRKDRKMHCIMILSLAIIVVSALIVLTKF